MPSLSIDATPERRGFGASSTYSATTVGAPDLEEAADLYYRKLPRGLAYLHFDSVEAAIAFVRDNLSSHQVTGAVLQVGEHRYEGTDIAAMVRLLAPQRGDAPLDA